MQRQTERQLLEKLVDLGNKFRLTPIVDDDFPAQRDNFDACLSCHSLLLGAGRYSYFLLPRWQRTPLPPFDPEALVVMQ